MGLGIDPARDALVIVDVQNDFCPGGALGVPDGDRVVPVLNRYAERFQAAGAAVLASRDWHPRRTRHFQEQGGAWPPHCVQSTPGAAFHRDLRLPAGTEIVSKGADPESDAYSCFQGETASGVPFAGALGARGVRRLFIGGLATDYCVKATALDALGQGYEVVVLEDAVAAVDLSPGDGARALADMRAAGARTVRLESLEGAPGS
jgi:nicotinamidase/pyrazinamidase